MFTLISGWFIKNTFNALRGSSGVEDFGKTAKWYWIGAILSIIGVGLILIIVAYAYAILGFRKLKTYNDLT